MDFYPLAGSGVIRSKIPLAAKYRQRSPRPYTNVRSSNNELSQLQFNDNDTFRSSQSDHEFSTISKALARNLTLKVHQKKEVKHRSQEKQKLRSPREDLSSDKYSTDTGLGLYRMGTTLSAGSMAGTRPSPHTSRPGSCSYTPSIKIHASSPDRRSSVVSESIIHAEIRRSITPELRKSVLSQVNRKRKFKFLPVNETPAGRATFMGSTHPEDPGTTIAMLHSDYMNSLDTQAIVNVPEAVSDEEEEIVIKETVDAGSQTSPPWSPHRPELKPYPKKTASIGTSTPVRTTNTNHTSVPLAREAFLTQQLERAQIDNQLQALKLGASQPTKVKSEYVVKPNVNSEKSQSVFSKTKKHVRLKQPAAPIVEDEIGENLDTLRPYVVAKQFVPKMRSEILTDSKGREYLLQSLNPNTTVQTSFPVIVGTDSIYHVETNTNSKFVPRSEDNLPYSVPYVPSGPTLRSESNFMSGECTPVNVSSRSYDNVSERWHGKFRHSLESSILDSSPRFRFKRHHKLYSKGLKFEPELRLKDVEPKTQFLLL